MTRDRVLSILWPEATADDGRRRLSTAVYDLRQLLGEAAIGSHGDDLWLDSRAVATDVDLFLTACRDRRWEQAAALYAGPLLDGVHVAEAPEFEEWLATQRESLDRQFRGALEGRALAAEAAGQWAEAGDVWRRLVALDPLSGRLTVSLMKALVAAGDRAGAIQAADRHASRLRHDLRVGPDTEVERFARELRARSAGPEATAAPPDVRQDLSAPVVAPADTPTPAPAPARRARARHLVAVGLLVIAAALGALFLASRATRIGATPAASVRVAVLPFRVAGDSTFAFLGEGLVDLLSTNLEGLGPLVTVDPHALVAAVRRAQRSGGSVVPSAIAGSLGAGRFVTGTVFGLRDTARIQAALHDATTGEVLRDARVSGPLDEVPALVDALAAQLAAGELRGAGDRLASVAALTTGSIPALRDFLAGETHFREGRFRSATAAYRRAVAADPTFALAHYRLSLAILWGNDPGATTELSDSLAQAHAGRLGERDRALINAYLAWRTGRAEEAERGYVGLVSRYPDDVEGWFQLGETLFHYNPRRGRPVGDARAAFERVVALDPTHWGARWHLALISAPDEPPEVLGQQLAELLTLGPDPISRVEMELLTGPLARMAPLPTDVEGLALFGAAWRRAVFARDLERSRQLFGMMVQGRNPYWRRIGQEGLLLLDLTRGRWSTARSSLRPLPAVGNFGLAAAAWIAILPGFERPPVELEALERLARGWAGGAVADDSGSRERERLVALTTIGLLRAAHGDSTSALAIASELSTATTADPREGPMVRGWVRSIRAYVAFRAGRFGDALGELAAGHLVQRYGTAVTSPGWSQGFERFLRAEALRALRRPEEALGWYGGLGEHSLYDLVFLGPALLRSAEINDSLGRSDLAAAQHARVAALWRDADPRYAPLVRRTAYPKP
jgi:DNA-binding SARP family transcriptional activator/TolB-like protein